MADIIVYVFAFVFAFVFEILFCAWLVRIKGGEYVYKRKDRHRIIFQTDCGTFVIQSSEQRVICTPKRGSSQTLPFDQIKGIHYRYGEKSAFFTEYLLTDWNLTDLFPAYRDKHLTFAIYLVLFPKESEAKENEKRFCMEDDPKIPLFVAKQYQIRDFIPIMPFFVWALGLQKDVATESRKVLNKILSAFKSVGKEMEILP